MNKVETFENVAGTWIASNGLLHVEGKTESEALKRFKHYQKTGLYEPFQDTRTNR